MKYGSVCSGIEAASVAWHPLGWEPQWFSEIEHFPSEVLKQRFPDVPNLGDMTQLTSNPTFNEKSIDLLVGGTPCQSFSVAGLRKGLADPRGNLMLTFLALADAKKPKWIVWENVPGVLSSNGGKDFGTFLGALGELGYGFAYRVLDAQHFGVAQRRRRVFVVGCLGDWRVAAAVLFERESLSGNTKPSRKKREEVTANAEGSVGEASSWWDGGQVAGTLTKQNANGAQRMPDKDNFGAILQPTIIDRAAFNQGENAQYEPRIEEGETMSSLVAKGPHAVAQPIAFEPGKMQRLGYGYSDNGTSPTLRSEPGDNQLAVAQPIAVDWRTAQVDQGITQTLKTDLAKMSGPCVAVDTYNQTINDHTTQTIRSQSGTDQIGAVLQPIAVDVYNQSIDGQTSATITEAVGGTNTSGPKVMQPIPINTMTMLGRPSDDKNPRMGLGIGNPGEPQNTLTKTHSHAVAQSIVSPTLTASNDPSRSPQSSEITNQVNAVFLSSMAIRRLTPKECERLQGFPDDWTKIPYRNKPADQCPDGPRYKACGNSMAVPVMRWIGERIQKIENLLNE